MHCLLSTVSSIENTFVPKQRKDHLLIIFHVLCFISVSSFSLDAHFSSKLLHSIINKIYTCFVRGILPFASASLQHYKAKSVLLRLIWFSQRCVMYRSRVISDGIPFLKAQTATACLLERRSSITTLSQSF